MVGIAVSGIAVATISMLVKRFWLKHNHQALKILGEILEHLMCLNQANNHFTMYMRNSEANANDALINIQTLQKQITSSSPRIRKMNKNVCERASKATTEMIDSIQKILTIDLTRWTAYPNHQITTNQTPTLSNQQIPALNFECD